MNGRWGRLAVEIGAAFCLGIAACSGGDNAGPAVPTTVTITPSGGTLVAITATLQLAAAVTDQHGHAIVSPNVAWSSTASSVVTVSANGLVTAVGNGIAQVVAVAGNATARVTVTVAQSPSALIKLSGDLQSDTTGRTLAAPLIVQVNDAAGHPVAGVLVTFATHSGSVNPTTTTTAANGQAQTQWTLGAISGQQTATATVGGLTGSPVVFTGTVIRSPNAPTVDGVAPDTLIEGQPATITGTKFSVTPDDNVVVIDGVQAVVTAASNTSLTVTVPAYDCEPGRLVDVTVSVAGLGDGKTGVPVQPATFVSLATGQETIVQNPSQFCFQFHASAGTPETYLIGMSAPAESPNSVMQFQVTATGGTLASPPLASRIAPRSLATASSLSPAVVNRLEALRRRARAEATLRGWEAANLPRLKAASRRTMRSAPALAPSAAAAVGDTVVVRVPSFSNPCTSYATIKTVVRVIGSAGIWLYDVQNPAADSLTLSDIQNASNEFDAKIYATDTLQFGHPSDVDNNGRVFVTLTWQVNKNPNVQGFVFGADLFPGPSCPQSNGAEMYYGEVPDSLNRAGTGARPKSVVVEEMPALIAHEFTHIIQYSQRLIFNDGQMLVSWEAEGQATFAEELVGDDVLGNTSYQNYDHRVAFGKNKGFDWYSDEMLDWAEYFGLLGSNSQAPNAPELCTVYGNPQMTTLPCYVSAFYGASWVFQRYIGDQYGPSYPGGLTQLTRDWVMKNPSLTGSSDITALLGVDYDSLFTRFATALALDDKNNGTGSGWVPQQFSITSWNSDSISTWLSTCCHFGWLTVTNIGFGSNSIARSVRGGSTAYTTVSAPGAHPATALKFRDANGAILGTTIRPTLWVVRIN
jgi:IPT/TIG domain/Bacterial Ig-like domain (group 2)